MKRLALITIIILLLSSSHAFAETMTSDEYIIRFGNFNITSGTKTSTNYTLTDTVGQTAAGEFSSNGYTVLAGFQYIYTLYNFAFSIDDLSIDFGSLTPNSFSSQTNTLTISAPGQGYAVTAIENSPLTNISSDEIPDTTCDSSCSETSAAVWTNTSNTGFGYNMSGNDIPTDFLNSTYFRPFPDLSSAEPPAIVMSSNTAGKNRSATVTYKVNIDSIQAAGDYSNIITFTATPTY